VLKHPSAAFFALTLGITYGVGLPIAAASHGLLPTNIPLWIGAATIYVSALVAIILSFLESGRSGLRQLLGQLLVWRVGRGGVVLGRRGFGPVERLLLGSVSEGVVHHATRPILVLRGGEGTWPPERVVIGDDGLEAAREAGALAGSIGAMFGSQSHPGARLSPFSFEGGPGKQGIPTSGVGRSALRAEMDLKERASKLEDVVESHPQVRVVEGDAVAAILETAQWVGGSTLIAVGSRGLGLVKRLRLGSVSAKVLRLPRVRCWCILERDTGACRIVVSAGVTSVSLFALVTAVATGLGALPFAFAKLPTRKWLGASNAVASGLKLAASFGLIYEGVNYGLFRTLAGALFGLASS
jgi:nucleotide-binding universal stress UspA family protein